MNTEIQGTLFNLGPKRDKKQDKLIEEVVNGLSEEQKTRWTNITTHIKENAKEGSLFTHPLRNGWLFQYLLWSDFIFTRRWAYWLDLSINKTEPEGPPPHITFSMPFNNSAVKHLRELMEYHSRKGLNNALEDFSEWVLWGFGDQGVQFPSRLPEEVSKYWYENFKLPLLHRWPADYMAELATDHYGKRSPNGFFPTPANVSVMMASMQFGDDWKENLHLSVCDPCVGTGIMLLAASNYSLNLYGMDINPLLVRLCKVNMWLYAPWAICQPPDSRSDMEQRIECSNSLIHPAVTKLKGVNYGS